MKQYTDVCYTTIEAGKIMGYCEGGVYTFKGIPYATAKRFHMPEKVKPWSETRSALVYREVSPVNNTHVNLSSFVDFSDRDLVENETCQFLNVWTTSLDQAAKHPVIFWLHGGGYFSGAGHELAAYDGHNLSEVGNIVFVSINHRLNVLGYMDMSSYGEEYKYSGNAGQADIVMALEWVRDNIESFGGDPNNVTIIGQSGGGGKVYTLMGMPNAQGLFHKAVAMSGGAGGRTQEEARAQTAAVLEKLGIHPENAKEMETIPYVRLAEAAEEAHYNASPVIDGDYYPASTIEDGVAVPMCRDIPLIVTRTFAEMNSNLQTCLFVSMEEGHMVDWDEATVDKKIRKKYGDKADAIVEEFKKAYPLHNIRDVLFIANRDNSQAIAKAKQNGAPVWQGVFAWNLPLFGGVTGWHTGGDMAYIFHNADKVPYIIAGNETGAKRFQNSCTSALIAFAYTGDPSTPQLPWPAFTAEEGATMIFDEVSQVGYYHDKKLQELLPSNLIFWGDGGPLFR